MKTKQQHIPRTKIVTITLAQPIPNDGQQPDPDRTTIPISSAQLSDIAELLDILDGFLRPRRRHRQLPLADK